MKMMHWKTRHDKSEKATTVFFGFISRSSSSIFRQKKHEEPSMIQDEDTDPQKSWSSWDDFSIQEKLSKDTSKDDKTFFLRFKLKRFDGKTSTMHKYDSDNVKATSPRSGNGACRRHSFVMMFQANNESNTMANAEKDNHLTRRWSLCNTVECSKRSCESLWDTPTKEKPRKHRSNNKDKRNHLRMHPNGIKSSTMNRNDSNYKSACITPYRPENLACRRHSLATMIQKESEQSPMRHDKDKTHMSRRRSMCASNERLQCERDVFNQKTSVANTSLRCPDPDESVYMKWSDRNDTSDMKGSRVGTTHSPILMKSDPDKKNGTSITLSERMQWNMLPSKHLLDDGSLLSASTVSDLSSKSPGVRRVYCIPDLNGEKKVTITQAPPQPQFTPPPIVILVKKKFCV
jgi:hypothetical protein